MAQRIVRFNDVSNFFLLGLSKQLPAGWGRLLLCVGYIAVCCLFLWFLHKKNVHLKV